MVTTSEQTTRPARPYVTSYEPGARHRRLFKVGNVFMRALIRTRLGEQMEGLSILTFTGRKTGTRYSVPVAVMDLDGAPLVLTAAPWRLNMRGGAVVEVRAGRKTRRMRATLVEDPEQVADAYETLLPAIGAAHSKRLGLVFAGDRLPSHRELVDGIGGRRFLIRLVEMS